MNDASKKYYETIGKAGKIPTDKVPKLKNVVTLAGTLAELDKYEIKSAVDAKGNDYNFITAEGTIQFDKEDEKCRQKFKLFCKDVTAKGDKSKNYTNLKKLLDSAIPMTKDKANATYLALEGSLRFNPYLGEDGNVKNYLEFSMGRYNPSTKDLYACEFECEGFVQKIKDEVFKRDDEEVATGRKVLRVFTLDFSNHAFPLDIIIPEDTVPELDNLDEQGIGLEPKTTASFVVDYIPHTTGKAKPVKTAGFGKTGLSTTGGSTTIVEKVLVGTSGAYEEPDDDDTNPVPYITKQMCQLMVNAYNEQIETVKSTPRPAKGGETTSASASKTKKTTTVADLDDDELPF